MNLIPFATALLMIAAAEMGDKTQLLTFALASKYPFRTVVSAVFAASAILCAFAVAFGALFNRFLPPGIVQLVAGLLFVGFGLWMIFDKGRNEDEKGGKNDNPFWIVFVSFFLAELGDKTQLAAFTLSADLGSPVQVWLGATLGLGGVNFIGALVGKYLHARLPQNLLKWVGVVIFLVVGIFTLTAPLTNAENTGPILITGGIKQNSPQRIISGIPSITEMLFALGLDERIVGVTLNCDYPPAALKKVKVGRETLSIETIISLRPDLVVLLKGTQDADIARLKKFNLPVMVIESKNVPEIKSALLALGKATQTEKQSLTLVAAIDREINEAGKIPEKGKIRKVLVLVGWNPLVTAAPESFMGEMIELAGGVNVAQGTKGLYPLLGFEQVLKSNPDVIILPDNLVNAAKEIYNDARWQTLSAVRGKRVFLMNADLLSRPGPRVGEAVKKMADLIWKPQ